MRISLLAAFAALLMLMPADSRADDAERTVRLVVECSPKTAEAIEHLLEGLPARVFRANPVAKVPPSKPAVRKPAPGVVSVLPIWEAIDEAVKAVGEEPLFWIDKMTINARSARIRVRTKETGSLDLLRAKLNESPILRSRTGSWDFVESGAVVTTRGMFKGDLTINLRPLPNAEGAKATSPDIGLARINAWREQAKLKPFRVGREMRENRSGMVTAFAREWVFEESSLENLRAFTRLADEAPGLVPTEIRWQLRDPSKGPDGSNLIQKPSVKLAGWLNK